MRQDQEQHFVDPFTTNKNGKTPLAVALNGGQSKALIQAAIHQFQYRTYPKIVAELIDGLKKANFGLNKKTFSVPDDVVFEITEFLCAGDKPHKLYEKLKESREEKERNFFKKRENRIAHPMGINM